MSDAGNDEYNIPLLKQPKQKKTKKIVEVVEEVKEPEIKKKARPPKTEKQIEQFKKMLEVRKQKVEQQKLNKKIEAAKLLVEQGVTPKTEAEPKKKVIKQAPKELEFEIFAKMYISCSPKWDKKVLINVSETTGKFESTTPIFNFTRSLYYTIYIACKMSKLPLNFRVPHAYIHR